MFSFVAALELSIAFPKLKRLYNGLDNGGQKIPEVACGVAPHLVF